MTTEQKSFDPVNALRAPLVQHFNEETEKAVLRDCVRDVLTRYFSDLEGHSVDDLYQLVLTEVEVPLLETVLNHTRGNQSKAAQLLGINRGTLRKKLKQYNISSQAEYPPI